MNSNHILIVWMPGDQIGDDRAYRDYVLESVRAGVLVLPSSATCEVMELPPLGGVEAVPAGTPSQSPAGPVTAPPEGEPGAAEGAEKRAILRRLMDWRAANGLGSLEKLSARTAHQKGQRISAETLRLLCAGAAPKLPMEAWRKIGRALDRLEQPKEAPADG